MILSGITSRETIDQYKLMESDALASWRPTYVYPVLSVKLLQCLPNFSQNLLSCPERKIRVILG